MMGDSTLFYTTKHVYVSVLIDKDKSTGANSVIPREDQGFANMTLVSEAQEFAMPKLDGHGNPKAIDI